MTRSVVLSAKIDADLEARIEKLASATRRTKSALVAEALTSFVANEEAFIAAVEEGRRAAREGRTVDHATVVAMIERLAGPDAK